VKIIVFTKVGNFVFQRMGLVWPIDPEVKGYLPLDITGLLNTLSACFISVMVLEALQ